MRRADGKNNGDDADQAQCRQSGTADGRVTAGDAVVHLPTAKQRPRRPRNSLLNIKSIDREFEFYEFFHS